MTSFSRHRGVTENAGRENDGRSKSQGVKMQDMKLQELRMLDTKIWHEIIVYTCSEVTWCQFATL